MITRINTQEVGAAGRISRKHAFKAGLAVAIACESGGAKLDHGSGGIVLVRAA